MCGKLGRVPGGSADGTPGIEKLLWLYGVYVCTDSPCIYVLVSFDVLTWVIEQQLSIKSDLML